MENLVLQALLELLNSTIKVNEGIAAQNYG